MARQGQHPVPRFPATCGPAVSESDDAGRMRSNSQGRGASQVIICRHSKVLPCQQEVPQGPQIQGCLGMHALLQCVGEAVCRPGHPVAALLLAQHLVHHTHATASAQVCGMQLPTVPHPGWPCITTCCSTRCRVPGRSSSSRAMSSRAAVPCAAVPAACSLSDGCGNEEAIGGRPSALMPVPLGRPWCCADRASLTGVAVTPVPAPFSCAAEVACVGAASRGVVWLSTCMQAIKLM